MPLQDLGEVKEKEGELEELGALLQILEDVGDGDEDLGSLVRSCRALKVLQTEQGTWEYDEDLDGLEETRKGTLGTRHAAAEP